MVNVCKKTCKECPFSNQSMKGWLADYDVQDIQNYMSREVSFPCHMMMSKDDMDANETKEAIANGEMSLCRGYVESVIKSAKMPYANKQLVEAIAQVREEGLSDNTMSIFEFINHHTISVKKL